MQRQRFRRPWDGPGIHEGLPQRRRKLIRDYQKSGGEGGLPKHDVGDGRGQVKRLLARAVPTRDLYERAPFSKGGAGLEAGGDFAPR